MRHALAALTVFLLSVLVLSSVTLAQTMTTKNIVAAAGSQPYFAGFWRCNNGATINVQPGFGPWLVYQHRNGSNEERSFVYHETRTNNWTKVGADSNGGYFTTRSSGWQGAQLTFSGSYTNGQGGSTSMRQTYTNWGPGRMQVTTWRNGTIVTQFRCSK